MAVVALCPSCRSQLGMPVAAPDAAELQCPVCEYRFALETTTVRELPMARVMATAPAAVDLNWQLNSHNAPATPLPPGVVERDFEINPQSASTVNAPVTLPSWDQLASMPTAAAAAEAARLEQLLASLPVDPAPPNATSMPTPLPASANDIETTDYSPPGGLPDDERARGEELKGFDDVPALTDMPTGAADDSNGDEFASGEFAREEADADYDPDEPGYGEGEEELVGAAPGQATHREFVLRPSPKRRPRPTTWRTMFGVVAGGIIGLMLASYVLIWLRGPQLDLFRMTAWMPATMLPASMRPATDLLAEEDATDDDDAATEQDGDFDVSVAQNDPDGDNDALTRPSDPAATAKRDESKVETAAADSAGDVGDTTRTIADAEPTTPEPADPVSDPAVAPANHAEPATTASDAAATPATPIDEPPAAAVTPVRPTIPPAPPRVNWPATPVVADLIGARMFSLDELTEVVIPAERAARKFIAGDYSVKENQIPMGQAYLKLCAVAERYTLTDPAATGVQLSTQQALGKGALQLVAGSAQRRADLDHVVVRWWTYDKTRKNFGIVFVGKIRELHPQGQWTESTIEVASATGAVQIPVLMDGIRYSTGAEVAVAGAIVEKPQEKLAGYVGDAPQVVVVGYIFDPAKFADIDAGDGSAFTLPGD